jgi:4-hydroxythreonine-4-phosphate dehydrogenase
MGVRLGVTMGDPAGIGPELVAGTLAELPVGETVIYGDRAALERAGARLPDGVALVEPLPGVTIAPGQPSLESGRAQLAYLEAAVADAAAGRLDALVTAPIHKGWCRRAGFAFPGHTELLAARLGAQRVTMLLAGPRLRVALATIHVPMAAVAAQLTVDGLAGTIVQTAHALAVEFAIARPRVAVAALNPHAGEGGQCGDEEMRLVEPALVRAREELRRDGHGALITGPHVPDAVFRDAATGSHDAVVALYHDQGLIPVKLIDFEEAVNVTLGLPVVRTSPDHGVAYDLAGSGRARSTSFRAALRMALRLAAGRSARQASDRSPPEDP